MILKAQSKQGKECDEIKTYEWLFFIVRLVFQLANFAATVCLIYSLIIFGIWHKLYLILHFCGLKLFSIF